MIGINLKRPGIVEALWLGAGAGLATFALGGDPANGGTDAPGNEWAAATVLTTLGCVMVLWAGCLTTTRQIRPIASDNRCLHRSPRLRLRSLSPPHHSRRRCPCDRQPDQERLHRPQHRVSRRPCRWRRGRRLASQTTSSRWMMRERRAISGRFPRRGRGVDRTGRGLSARGRAAASQPSVRRR